MGRSGLKSPGSPYGHKRNVDKAPVVGKSEAGVVSKNFKLYSRNRTLGKAAHAMNRTQMLTRRGKSFSRMSNKTSLNNKTEIGGIVNNWVETKVIQKTIVLIRQWTRYNEILTRLV